MAHWLRCSSFFLVVTPALFAVAFTGCGRKEDLKKANSVVENALIAWKNGATPDSLVAQGIEIADENWKSGDKLLDFSIKTASSQPQQGPRVVVMLNLQQSIGKKIDIEIAYEVIPGDKTKIVRDPFHIP